MLYTHTHLLAKVFSSLSIYEPSELKDQKQTTGVSITNYLKCLAEGKEADQKIEALNDAFDVYKPIFNPADETHEVHRICLFTQKVLIHTYISRSSYREYLTYFGPNATGLRKQERTRPISFLRKGSDPTAKKQLKTVIRIYQICLL